LELFLTALFPIFFLFLPGLSLAKLAAKRGWIERASFSGLILFGLTFHLYSSLLYRLLATSLGVGIWPYFLAHGVFLWIPLSALAQQKRPWKDWLKTQLFERWRPEQKAIFRVYVALVVVLIAMMRHYLIKPLQYYYGDELFRLSFANFIPARFPPKDFLTYSSQNIHYYSIAEAWTANIGQFSGMPIPELYLHYLVFFHWLLLLVGVIGLLLEGGQSKPLLIFALVLLFFWVHGPAGEQKISHFVFRQNSLALAIMALSSFGIFRFYKSGRYVYFISAILLASLVVGIKTVGIMPLGLLIPAVGLAMFIKKRLSFSKLTLAGMLSLGSILFWYFLVVATPVEGESAYLMFEPRHYWSMAYARRIIEHPMFLYPPIEQFLDQNLGFEPRPFLLPLFYSFEFVLLAIGALWGYQRDERAALDMPGGFLLAGGFLTMMVMTLWRFSISESSTVYFLIFGSWAFNLGVLYLFHRAVPLVRARHALVYVSVILIFALNAYAGQSLRHLYGPGSHVQTSDEEMEAYRILREETDQRSYVYHNQYRQKKFNIPALAERRAVISYLYDGAIFQSKELYLARFAEADRFFGGQMSPKEMQQTLDQYEVDALLWDTQETPPMDLEFAGFVKRIDHPHLKLWLRLNPLAGRTQ